MIRIKNHIISFVCWECTMAIHTLPSLFPLVLLFPYSTQLITSSTGYMFYMPQSSCALPQQSCNVYQNFPSILPWLCVFTLIFFFIANDLCNFSFHAHLLHKKSNSNLPWNYHWIKSYDYYSTTKLLSPISKNCRLFWFTDWCVTLHYAGVFSYACIVYTNEW